MKNQHHPKNIANCLINRNMLIFLSDTIYFSFTGIKFRRHKPTRTIKSLASLAGTNPCEIYLTTAPKGKGNISIQAEK